MKKLLALLLALVMVVALVACGGTNTPDPEAQNTETPAENPTEAPENPDNPDNPTEEPVVTDEPTPTEVPDPDMVPELDIMGLNSYKYAEKNDAGEWEGDYVSLYDYCGKDVKIADVEEDPDTGFAYIEVDGEKKLLGMDFLSMAMVYNNDPEGSEYADEEEVYAAWWRLYITRWNYLLPEVPLYSNEYYDVYNAQIKGTDEHPTNPFWNVVPALIDWTSDKPDHDFIIGNSTELSGAFRYAAFGKNSPAASDNDIETLTSGLATVTNTKEGGYVWDDNVVAAHTEEVDADGNKTYTITLQPDLQFSDGTPITAKDYLAFSMAMYTPVGAEAAGKTMQALSTLGWSGNTGYGAYTGPDSEAGNKVWTGLHLLGDLQFSVTISADYLPYFYDITYAAFTPYPKAMLLGEADILDDGEGCYLTDDFYAKNGDKYVMADFINKNFTDKSNAAWSAYPWAGPYMVESYDQTDATAVLVKNPYYKGNYEGTKPGIEKIIYRKAVSDTQIEDLKTGGIDCIAAITGGKDTDNALKLCEESNGGFVYTHYSRAGYGKLGFRADYGPAQFTAVRQAIALCMDRAQFAKDFTGGYGGVVDGPYYTGSWMYKEAVDQNMMLDTYPTSADSAIEVLEQGGWIYNADGSEYTGEGIRYKKIPGDLINENDMNYQSKDGAYKTEKVGDDYYMPLVINWYGTTPNEFTDLLLTGFMANPNIERAGMKVYNQLGDFPPMLDELYQAAVYGYYAGTPMYCAFNFATGFNSAVYDYSYNWTINPDQYGDYSICYLKDYADVLWLIER